jgi:squalene synthase HpnC
VPGGATRWEPAALAAGRGRGEAGAAPRGAAGDRGADPSEALLTAFPADALLARARGENFPVALRLLPRRLRAHLLAIYGFARLADELGDAYGGDRLAALDALEVDLDRAFDGRALHPLLRQLAPTLRTCGLSRAPFARLVEANRRDQRIRRHASFDALLHSCELSANPVGELVLEVFGAATPRAVALSDRICSALQLAEHCQDVGEDFAAGRVYLPAEVLAACGCPEADLGAASASPPLREAVRRVAERARELLREGEPLLGELRGTARLAVAGFAAGGHAALDGLERIGFDVLGARARVRRRDLLRHAARLLGRRGRSA